MISLSRTARVPGDGLSPDTPLSGSLYMSSTEGRGRVGAGLKHALGDRVVSEVYVSWLSVIAAPVSGVASPGL